MFCSNISGVHWRRAAGSAQPASKVLEGSMEQQSNVKASGSSQTPHHEGRGVWVLTAYGISGLALFGVLIYYFSVYVTH
jgi:hypothetical protein